MAIRVDESIAGFTLRVQPLEEYLDMLASKQPTPGGGTAAALTGAQGVALLAMVCQLTLGKKQFAIHDSELEHLLASFEQYRKHFLALAQQDVDAFQTVIAAYRLPKCKGKELETRANAIQLALKAAAEIPFELFASCAAIIPLADALEAISNPAVLSDITVGRYLLYASLLSAKANVDINLAAIIDAVFCQSKREAMQQALVPLHSAFLSLWPHTAPYRSL